MTGAYGVAVRLRLTRIGRRNRPAYRVAVYDARTKRNGRVIEELGHYNPLDKEETGVRINKERAEYWLSVGAQPSETVRFLLRRQGVEVSRKK
jgi:small subunit ribosomal protein S16